MRRRRAFGEGHRSGSATGEPVNGATDRAAAGTSATTPTRPPDRVLALTDGVVAIAMTLLVLDLGVDYRGDSVSGLVNALGEQGGRFIAFFIAFWVIAQFWVIHHRVFRRITRHEDSLAMRNFWFLFGISLLPFTTGLLGESDVNPLPVTLFSGNLLLISVSMSWLASSAERLGAAEPPLDERQIVMVRARRIATATLLALPGALAWVIRPGIAELLFLLLLLADVPGRLLAARRLRRSTTGST